MVAGFSWIRGQLPDELVEQAKARKGRRSWDAYLAQLITNDVRTDVPAVLLSLVRPTVDTTDARAPRHPTPAPQDEPLFDDPTPSTVAQAIAARDQALRAQIQKERAPRGRAIKVATGPAAAKPATAPAPSPPDQPGPLCQVDVDELLKGSGIDITTNPFTVVDAAKGDSK